MTIKDAALGVVRLSRDDESSTSVDRQRAAIEALAASKGLRVVGWAEDVDVAGDVAPWARPSLGEWLPNPSTFDTPTPERKRLGEFAHLIVWKLDRLSRKTVHLLQTVEMLTDRGVSVHSVDDGYDPSGAAGKLLLSVLGTVAQGEHEAMKLRAKRSRAELRTVGRFPGGTPPFGYSIVPAERGYRLVVDPSQAATIRDIVTRVVGGEALSGVVMSLNNGGVPSPFDQQRIKGGKPAKGNSWRVSNLNRLLKSPTLLGYATVKTPDGKGYQVIRGEDGEPIRRADPILTPDELQSVSEALAARARGGAAHKDKKPAPFTGVAKCACGRNMYRVAGRNKGRIYLRCASVQTKGRCDVSGGKSIPEQTVFDTMLWSFLIFRGTSRVRRVFVQGTDNSAELASVNESLTELMDDRAAGLYRGPELTEKFRGMVRALEARRDALEAAGSRADRWEYVETGETWADWLQANRDHPAEVAGVFRSLGVAAVVWDEPKAADGYMSPLAAPGHDRVALAARDRVVIDGPADLKFRILTH